MELKIKRTYYPDFTEGKLYINGVFFCDTLEDPNRDLNMNGKFDDGEVKIYGDTCIPPKIYNIVMTHSPKFKKILPLVENVPNFTGIRIHSGVHKLHTDGCILVGNKVSDGKLDGNKRVLDALVSILIEADRRKEKITLKID